MGGAFYEQVGHDRYVATGHTIGPWSDTSQHMGAPAALLTGAFENCEPRADTVLSRLTFEILGAVPVGEVSVHAAIERPGRAVELLSAELRAADRVFVRARAWRLERNDTAEIAAGGPPALAPPHDAAPIPIPAPFRCGYMAATEWRTLSGGMTGTGEATVWGRLLVDVVDGEEPTPLQRLCAIADSGNGFSNRVDIAKWLFVNTDLTVHLHRPPVADWFALDAETTIGPTGAGVAASVLHDLDGPVGRAAQSLLVRER